MDVVYTLCCCLSIFVADNDWYFLLQFIQGRVQGCNLGVVNRVAEGYEEGRAWEEVCHSPLQKVSGRGLSSSLDFFSICHMLHLCAFYAMFCKGQVDQFNRC